MVLQHATWCCRRRIVVIRGELLLLVSECGWGGGAGKGMGGVGGPSPQPDGVLLHQVLLPN